MPKPSTPLDLDPKGVRELKLFSRSRRGGADIRSGRIELTYEPTGTKVSGETLAGTYTNAQMRAVVEKLRMELYTELDRAVRQVLRQRGR